MQFCRLSPCRRFFGWVGLVVIPCVVALAAPSTEAPWSGTPAERDTWVQGLSLLAQGQLDAATAKLHDLAKSGASDPRVQKIDTLLESFTALHEARLDRQRAEYDKYVGWIKEDTAAKKWRRAIINCGRAYSNALDQDVFRAQPYVTEAVQGATQLAREYEDKGKWYKAAGIYLTLREIFPTEVAYREAVQRCQEHIRLELTYDTDTEWEEAVEDITPSMAREAFRRIHDSYLREADFKALTISALKHMLRLTEEPDLVKTFEKLGDEDEVAEFRARIQPWLLRAQKRSRLSLTNMTETFNRVLKINREIRLLPQTMLVREFVHGALQPLDQFSDMLWPADTEEFNKHTQGKFTGVGISIRKPRGEPIRVISPLEGTPAYRAGIRPGDVITRIDGRPAAPLSITRAVQEITGPPDTSVVLTIKRPGEEKAFDVKLKRAEITIHTVKGISREDDGTWNFMADPEHKIAYVRLTNFMEETAGELADTLNTLRDEEGMRGLILDLRGNPGGLLKAAIDVSSLFLTGDREIVSTRDRRGNKDLQMSTIEPDHAFDHDLPMIVLVNRSSASASEIVAGALQVHGRALILGQRSYGKGSVQQVLPVTPSRRAFLKLTTARYYLPNGRCLHREEDSETWGVDPDFTYRLVPKEIVQINNLRTRRDILKGVNQDELTDEDFDMVFSTQPANDEDEDELADAEDEEEEEDEPRDDPNDWPEIDPQLDVATLLMQVRLESDYPWPASTAEVAAKE